MFSSKLSSLGSEEDDIETANLKGLKNIVNDNGIVFTMGEECKTIENLEYLNPKSVDYFRRGRLKLGDISANYKYKQVFEIEKQFPQSPSLMLNLTPGDILNTLPDPPKYKNEPQTGLFPKHINVDKYNSIRLSEEKTPFKKYIPSKFAPLLPPLKRFDQFNAQETISKPEDIYTVQPQFIQKILLENIRIKSDKFHQRLSSFQYCVVLVMRCMNLDTLVGINLPLLRVLDVRFNNISVLDNILPMLRASPFIEHLVVMDNPIEKILNWRPILIGTCPRIISLNGQTVSFSERENANDVYGTVVSRKVFSFLKWDERMNALCERLELETWQPENITVLSLPNAKLTEFHIGNMVNLKELDLSNNNISTIKGCGLERLEKLREFNINDNAISETHCLRVLTYIPSLRRLWICENPYDTTEKEDNRIWYYIVYLTINLKGDNRCVGLLELDDIKITSDHRLKSIKIFSENIQDEDLSRLRWNYSIINHFGHHQLRQLCNGQYMSIVTKLVLPKCSLMLADLTFFVSLEYVDLHGNNLVSANGIENLRSLKFIDLSGNPKLDRDPVINSLSKLSNLLYVNISSDLSKLQLDRNLNSTESVRRASILKILLDRNEKLLCLDNVKIDIIERSRIVKVLKDLSEIEELKFRFNLSIILQVFSSPFNEKIKLSYKDIVIGKMYDPTLITKLYLRDCGLKDVGTDFSHFISLTCLDISHNMINNILDIGLERCREIKYLDLGFNNIANKLVDIVNMLHRMCELEMVSLYGNPEIEKQKNYKIKILKDLNNLRGGLKLVIFNTKITSQERQQVWNEKEESRLQKIIEEKGYHLNKALSIFEINLNESGIERLDNYIGAFRNLEKLLLRGNQFNSKLSVSCPGIFELKLLKILDLRNNKLTDLDEVIMIVNQNPFLECLGVYTSTVENEDANFSQYTEQQVRSIIISNTPRLANIFCPFWEIDEKEITVNEIVNNWPLQDGNAKDFQFQACVFKKYLQTVKERDIWKVTINPVTIVSLNLSESNLGHVDFSRFLHLKKLSLAKNIITDNALSESGLEKTEIEELDLQYNLISSVEVITKFIDNKKSLKKLTLIYNPIYKMNMQTARSIEKETTDRVIASTFETSHEYVETRKDIISKIQSARCPDWIFELDGKIVTVSERCDAIAKEMTFHELEHTRLRLTLNECKYYDTESLTIKLNYKGIKLLNSLKDFRLLTHLDLRGNLIKQLDKALFTNLKKLHHLDIRDNDISVQDEQLVLNIIGASGSLRTLFLQRCGRKIFIDPVKYYIQVFSTLRLLQNVDDFTNPFPLSKSQLLSTQFLQNNYNVSPNSLTDIQIDDQINTLNQFYALLLSLSSLVTLYDTNLVSIVNNKEKSYNLGGIAPPNESSKSPTPAISRQTTIDTQNDRNQMYIASESKIELIGPKSIYFRSFNIPVSDCRLLLMSHIRTLDEIDGRLVTSNDKAITITEIDRLRTIIERKGYNLRPVLTYSAVRNSIVDQLSKEHLNETVRGLFARNDSENQPNISTSNNNNSKTKATKVSPTKNWSNITNATLPMDETIPNYHHPSLLFNDKFSEMILKDPHGTLVPFEFIQDNYQNIKILQQYQDILSLKGQYTNLFDGIFEKIYFLLFALQMYSICYSFSIPWPHYYNILIKYNVLSINSLDLIWKTIKYNNYYFIYSWEMFLPGFFLIMFLLNPNYKTSLKLFVKKLCWTIFLCVLCFIIALLLVAASSFAVFPSTYEEFARGELPSSIDVWGLFGFSVAVILLLFSIFVVYVIIYRVKYYDQMFFINFIKVRQRLLWIFFTLFYFICVRSIISSFECESDMISLVTTNTTLVPIWTVENYNATDSFRNISNLRIFNNEACPQSLFEPLKFPTMYWVSIGFGILYLILIPLMFLVFIYKNHSKIIYENSINDDLLLLKRKKKEYKKKINNVDDSNTPIKESTSTEERKLLLKLIKKNENIIYKKYINGIRNSTSSISVAFESFKNLFKYQFLFYVFEFIAMACLASFLNTNLILQAPIGSGIMFSVSVYMILFRPYHDITLSISSSILHLVLSFNLLFGYWLLRFKEIKELEIDWLIISSANQSIILYVINGATISLLLILNFIIPFVRNYVWIRNELNCEDHEEDQKAKDRRSKRMSLRPSNMFAHGKSAPSIAHGNSNEIDYAFENSYFDVFEQQEIQPTRKEIFVVDSIEMNTISIDSPPRLVTSPISMPSPRQ